MIVDGAERVGDSWRHRWDSLTLFTPRRYDALPGMPFPGDPEGYPGKDEVADYLELYATSQDLPVRLGSPVTSVGCDGDGPLRGRGRRRDAFEARQVVVASGAFTGPAVPGFAGWLASGSCSCTAAPTAIRRPCRRARCSWWAPAHRRPAGAGAGGRRAAGLAGGLDAAPGGPRAAAGPQLLLVVELLHGLDAGPDTRLGRRLRNDDTVLGTDLKALFGRVERLPRVLDADHAGCSSRTAAADGPTWCCGPPASAPRTRGCTCRCSTRTARRSTTTASPTCPGWCSSACRGSAIRGSALLGWVGRDAALLADRLADQLATGSPRFTSELMLLPGSGPGPRNRAAAEQRSR